MKVTMDNYQQDLIKKIHEVLVKMNVREETNDKGKESELNSNKRDRRVEHATHQIQNSFDRIHDKIFQFNNILIAAYLVLGTFPSDQPMLKLGWILIPTINLVFLMFLEHRQMEIHRYASTEPDWTNEDGEKYGRMIQFQTLLSFLSFLISIFGLAYLLFKLW